MPLTAEQRQAIRMAIHERQKKAYLRELDGKLCSGCGCARDTFSKGCHTCHDRKRKRGRDHHRKRPVVRCACGTRTRSKYGICTTCQRNTGFVASRQEAA